MLMNLWFLHVIGTWQGTTWTRGWPWSRTSTPWGKQISLILKKTLWKDTCKPYVKYKMLMNLRFLHVIGTWQGTTWTRGWPWSRTSSPSGNQISLIMKMQTSWQIRDAAYEPTVFLCSRHQSMNMKFLYFNKVLISPFIGVRVWAVLA